MLGRRAADLVGTALGDLVHPDDQHDVSISLTKLAEAPGAAANFGCRLQHDDGSWRHVESVCTNLANDPRVHGLVLNIRDVTEQAALRKSIGELYHNLARRSQGLVDRQLELIEELERGEVDPDRLDELVRIDHLATRMRRNAENLIVLSGVEQHRRLSEPVPLRDVVEAALAELKEYSRVQVAPMDDLRLSGQAASDVAHLLAELVGNATSFSPPGTMVQISGGPAGTGYVLEIEDRGIGMSDAELIEANRRLAAPLAADVAVSKMMGFHVVGRLASRYGIKVSFATPGTTGSPRWCCCRRSCSPRLANAQPWHRRCRLAAQSRRIRSCRLRLRRRAGSRARTCRYGGTQRRHQTVARTGDHHRPDGSGTPSRPVPVTGRLTALRSRGHRYFQESTRPAIP
jgi:PAS domain S-box-containing protein